MSERDRALLEGLLNEEQRRLYQQNAWFHQGVNSFVRFLPFFVAGLAADAEEKDAAMQRDLAILKRP